MKMYKKSELTINHGLLVSNDGDIVLPDSRIVDQANELETIAQQAEYLGRQPEATPMPTLDGFERMSIKDSGVKFNAITPLMDKKSEEAMKLMNELDDIATVDKANEMLAHFDALLDFINQDFVVDCGDALYCFDTPTLGSVLELTKDDVANVIAKVCGMVEEGITKRDVLVDPISGDIVDTKDETPEE